MSTQKYSEKGAWNDNEASSGEGERAQHTENVKQGGKFKRHCSHWWWLYLLAFMLALIVIIIPIIFVGIRNMAQSALNKATVTVSAQSASSPFPDQIGLTINSTVVSHTNRKATIESFNASFYLPDNNPETAFFFVDFPELDSSVPSQPVNIGQNPTKIANVTQFTAYNTRVLNSEEFQVGVRGHTHAVLSGLPKYPVTYDKVITMKGFNKFHGLKIYNVVVDFFNPQFDGANLLGKVYIPNPSVIDVYLGNITMNVASNGTNLGSAVLEYVELKPGDNTVDMRAFLDVATTLNYTIDYTIDLQLTGQKCTNFFNQTLEYYSDALKTNTINYRLNLTEAAAATSPSQVNGGW